jgi:uncharacterized protein (DUF58 family)
MNPLQGTAKLHGYTAVGALSLVAALLLRRPELVCAGAPFLLLATMLVVRGAPALAHAEASVDAERAVEGDLVTVRCELRAASRVPRLAVHLVLPPALHAEAPGATRAITLRAGEPSTVSFPVGCDRFGAHDLEEIRLRSSDALGLVARDLRVPLRRLLRVYPHRERLSTALRPLQTQVRSGNRRSPALGSGIEFAGIRPFVPGDRPRHVNWRLSTRHRSLYVDEFHPERNAEVVLLLDSFADVGDSTHSTLSAGVHACAALAAAFLAERDRVGVVGYGGMVRWLLPGMGAAQHQRILDGLLDTEVSLHYAWKGIDLLPPRMLPPSALVVVVSPLVDDRMLSVITDLRGRRFDVCVLEVSPIPYTRAGTGPTDGLAHRIWILQRAALRQRLLRQGIAVAEWREGWPLVQPLEEMGRFRRFAATGRS